MNAHHSILYRFLILIAALGVPYTALLTIDLVLHPLTPEFFYGSVVFRWLLGLIIAPVTLAIGFLIIRRKPGNVVGPMLMVWGASVATWAVRNDVDVSTMAALSNAASVGWGILIALFFYFPTGVVVPARWHWAVSWVFLCGIAATFLIIPTSETLIILRQGFPNPAYLPNLAPFRGVLELLIAIPIMLLPVMVYSVYRRYRQANLEERQQLKWLAFASLLYLLFTPVTLLLSNLPGEAANTVNLLATSWIYFFPALTVGNAILRHRLYDIDIIIRRTLIYSVLTGILAALYFGAIILTQQVFRAATGQTSDLAIVVSTLFIAALFSPIRRRVQDTIDRRLYRRKYDVEQTLANFQKNLREDVDMATLQANLIGVVSETMQPDKIALWVKE